MIDYSEIMPYCESDTQRKYLQAYIDHGSSTKAGKALGHYDHKRVATAITRIKRLAEDRGVDPDTFRNHPLPSSQVVKGYSDLIRFPEDDPLNRVIGWVKTNRALVDQLDDARAVLAAMADEIEPIDKIKFKGRPKCKSQFSVIPVGDPHIGLRTWAKEVGTDWDVPIAKRVFEKVFQRLLARAPDTEEAVLINTGDFFHADNVAGETSRSKNKLDLDGRAAYWLDAGVTVLRMLIDACLKKYKKVHFYNVPGNHDDILGLALGVFSKNIYDHNPRLIVHGGENPFQYFRKGNVLLGFAHGHTCKLASLPGKMADDQSELWGQTTYRHWFTGHVHHNQFVQFKEHSGATVESVGIIPPKDAYAHGAGYGAGRGTQLVVFDDQLGEIERYRETVQATD
jgi:hypothetical protein